MRNSSSVLTSPIRYNNVLDSDQFKLSGAAKSECDTENRGVLLSHGCSVVLLRETNTEVERLATQLDLNVMVEAVPSSMSTGPQHVIALLDSGCTVSVLDESLALALGCQQKPLARPVKVTNADGTQNRKGLITPSTVVRLSCF